MVGRIRQVLPVARQILGQVAADRKTLLQEEMALQEL
jgi:hypothetical protein